MPDTQLSPDALASMARIHFESGRTDHRKWEHLYPEIQDTLIAEMRTYAEAVLATAEAREQAELEAEALELYNAGDLAGEFQSGPHDSFALIPKHAQPRWLAVARKARELGERAEK